MTTLFLNRLGLCHPSEHTTQKLASIALLHTLGVDGAIQLSWEQKRVCVDMAKNVFKTYKGDAITHQPLHRLPSHPNQLMQLNPTMYASAYGDTPPPPCQLNTFANAT